MKITYIIEHKVHNFVGQQEKELSSAVIVLREILACHIRRSI